MNIETVFKHLTDDGFIICKDANEQYIVLLNGVEIGELINVLSDKPIEFKEFEGAVISNTKRLSLETIPYLYISKEQIEKEEKELKHKKSESLKKTKEVINKLLEKQLQKNEVKFLTSIKNKRCLTERQAAWLVDLANKFDIAFEMTSPVRASRTPTVPYFDVDAYIVRDGERYDLDTGFLVGK